MYCYNRYIDYCSTTYKDSHGDKYRDKYRDDSYDQIRGRSKEKDYLYYDDDIFASEIRRLHKILQTMSQEKEMAIGFMLAFSENPEKILDSIHSQAEHLIAKRIEFAKIQKAEKLAKDQHENISNTNSQSNVNPVNCEPINFDISLTQDPQENVESIQSVSIITTSIEGKVDNYPIQHSVISTHE